jgi:hypothetical protein
MLLKIGKLSKNLGVPTQAKWVPIFCEGRISADYVGEEPKGKNWGIKNAG